MIIDKLTQTARELTHEQWIAEDVQQLKKLEQEIGLHWADILVKLNSQELEETVPVQKWLMHFSSLYAALRDGDE